MVPHEYAGIACTIGEEAEESTFTDSESDTMSKADMLE